MIQLYRTLSLPCDEDNGQVIADLKWSMYGSFDIFANTVLFVEPSALD